MFMVPPFILSQNRAYDNCPYGRAVRGREEGINSFILDYASMLFQRFSYRKYEL